MLTCVRIYIDWQTEWASADSRRLLPITSIPFWDVKAAEEVRSCASMGHRGIRASRAAPLIYKIGADSVLFETDFPHTTPLCGDQVHAPVES